MRNLFSSTPLRPFFLVMLLANLALIASCALPPLQERMASTVISPQETENTRLGQAFKSTMEENPELSGIYALTDAHDAFAMRALLTHVADKSIDVQYYIWRNDTTGMLLLKQLADASQRGVRVRLLIDDNGVTDLDQVLAQLNSSPNIEVRLFNPFSIRKLKPLNYLTEFSRLNHRMHNKSFTVDNMATIVGGRNIGDEYFGATDQTLFADLDILAIGTVAKSVSIDFDRYWASPLAYPIDQVVPLKNSTTDTAIDLNELLRKNPEETQLYLNTLQQSDFAQQLLDQELQLEWVKVEMVSDDPIKAEGKAKDNQLLTYQLQHAIGSPKSHVDLISPYFVPTKAGATAFAQLATQSGIKIRILTNSYEATDVSAVHAGYMKRRKTLLNADIELYELKRISSSNLVKKVKNPFAGASGSSSSLHAKTFAIDGERVFVGSFNFDPRSANLNTELGFVIHSSALAQEISNIFTQQVPFSSYQVLLENNQLIWLEQDEDQTKRIYTTEPGTSAFSRWWVLFMSKLPIEWLL